MLNFLLFISSLFTKVVNMTMKLKNKMSKKEDDKVSPTTKILNMLSNIGLFVSTAVGFIIMLPLVIKLVFIVLLVFIILASILLIISIMASVSDGLEGVLDANGTAGLGANGATGSYGDGLAFTEQELAQYGTALSGYEKNMYRLGIASRSAVETYKGDSELSTLDKKVNITFLLGISSTETSMRFYDGQGFNESKNILKDPSDKGLNSSGFGVMGLCGRSGGCGSSSAQWTLNKLSIEEKAKLVSLWGEPDRPRDINFYPYATYFAYKHLEGKTSSVERYVDKAMEVLKTEWGIASNLKEHRTVIYHMLLQAAFHGVSFPDEYRNYANMWGALLHATSEIDAERSFYKWTIPIDAKSDYSESSMRKTMFGTGGCKNFPKGSNPENWKGLGTPLSINGQQLTKPLWAYLHEKYKDHKGFMEAFNQMYEWGSACSATGSSARILNFHYGFNSFLQGNRIMDLLQSKMQVPTNASAGGTVQGGQLVVKNGSLLTLGQKLRANKVPNATAGQPQGTVTINGKTTSMSQHLASYYSKKYYNYYRRLLPHTGTAGEYTNSKHPILLLKGKHDPYNFFNVPFYMQDFKSETYNKQVMGATGGSLFGYEGCMIYSMAHVATMLTGKLINPPEMSLYMLSRSAITSGGASMDEKHSKIMKELVSPTLKTKYVSGTKHSELIKVVTDEIAKGGALAIVRLGPTHGYAYGPNHYVVLTGAVKNVDGTIGYTMFSSSSLEHSTMLHSRQHLAESPGSRAQATIFYYK